MTILTPAPKGYPIKIVRDRTPEIINKTREPGKLWYERAPEGLFDPKLLKALRQKLIEEVGEYLLGGSTNELVDVYAVIIGLAYQHGINNIDRMYHDDPRGGFFDGVMMYGRHKEFDKK